MKSSYQEQQELNIEVAAMKAENERNITITKSKLSTIVNNSNQHFNESKLMISKKSDDIVNLFHQFKKFNKEIEKDFTLLVITKKQINIFLDKYFFVKNNGVPERLLLENYDADFKNIINDFLQIYGENKYHEILNSIKNFNNYKKNNDQQVVISNESKGNKLFDLEKLKLELGSIINLIPNY